MSEQMLFHNRHIRIVWDIPVEPTAQPGFIKPYVYSQIGLLFHPGILQPTRRTKPYVQHCTPENVGLKPPTRRTKSFRVIEATSRRPLEIA